MPYQDLRAFLAAAGDSLLTISETLNPRHEVAAVLSESQGLGKAVLCESVEGYPGVRVAGNLLASRALMARGLGTTPERLTQAYLDAKRHARAPVMVAGPAPVKQTIHKAPSDVLAVLPILTHYEKDAAPYVTCGVVFARDPETGRRAMGIHRMMFRGGNRFNIFLANPPISHLLAAAEAAGRPLEVAVALGLDPATLVASVIRAGSAGPDKVEIAGGLRGSPLEMTEGVSVDLAVPAFAEAVMEGRVLPGVREQDGPFGENTGYYFSDLTPVMEVSAILCRQDFIYGGLCPWTAEVDNLLSLAAGAELLGQLRQHSYGIQDVELSAGACGFNAVIAVSKLPRHEARRVILLALSIDKRLKSVTVVDDDVDVRDPRQVAWAMATRYQPDRDTIILGDTEAYVIDPSSTARGGSKVGFDATSGDGGRRELIRLPQAAVAKARAAIARGRPS